MIAAFRDERRVLRYGLTDGAGVSGARVNHRNRAARSITKTNEVVAGGVQNATMFFFSLPCHRVSILVLECAAFPEFPGQTLEEHGSHGPPAAALPSGAINSQHCLSKGSHELPLNSD